MAIAIFAALTVLLLPVVLWKTVGLGQGDVQVFFRAGWALWTGYPLYEVTDHHGWTFHYPPTFALFMAPFANPLPDYPQPVWALPFAAAVAVWYVINAVGLFLALHVWANALERQVPVEAKGGIFAEPVDAATRSAPGTFAVCRRRLGARTASACAAPPTSPLLWPVRRETPGNSGFCFFTRYCL